MTAQPAPPNLATAYWLCAVLTENSIRLEHDPAGAVVNPAHPPGCTRCAHSAPHHPALDPFHRKERFGRVHFWVDGLPGGESQTGQEHAIKA